MSTPDLSARRANLSEAKRALLEKLLRGKSARSAEAPAIRPRQDRDNAPLSSSQRRLWFLDQLVPNHPFYVIPAAVRLSGTLNVSALEQSLNRIVMRHESLRTSFGSRHGQAVQVIDPSLTLTIPIIDLSEVNGDQATETALKLARQEAQRPFNLGQSPLFRVTLLRIYDYENLTAAGSAGVSPAVLPYEVGSAPSRKVLHLLLLMMHHIISDEWSLGILVREIALIYEAYVTGTTPSLPDLQIQYADFGAWQQEWLQGEVCQKQLSYWTQQLSGVPSILDLPTDYRRPSVPSFRGNRQQLSIARGVTEPLNTLGERNGATLFMVVMAGFNVLLHRYTGQHDIAIGFPIATRDRSEVEGLIGCLLNTLVMRSDLSGDPSFVETLARVKRVSLEAYAHQEIPFERIVDEVQPERDLSRNPLCNVMFVFQNVVMPALELPGVRLTPIQIHNDTAKLDLALAVTEGPDGLAGYFEYSEDLFEDSTISRMIGHLQNLIASIVTSPDRPISSLALLNESERQQLMSWAGSNSPLPQDRCIHQLIESQVERTPEAIALAFGSRQITYDALNRQANQLANYLAAMGVGPDTVVGVCMKGSPEMIVGTLAVLKSGAAYLPLDPEYPDQRLAMMIDHSRMPVLITRDEFSDRLPAFPGQVIVLDSDQQQIELMSDECPSTDVLADNLAYVIYTSGSTGKPKGVQATHRGLLNLVLWHLREFNVGTLDRATQIANAGFDACVWEIWPYLAAGASIHIAEESIRTSPTELQKWITANHITISFLATPLAERAVALESPWTSSLRFLLTGGDKLHHHPSTKLPFTVVNNYGPTENTVVTTSGIVTEGGAEAPLIGRPIFNTRIYVLSPESELMPEGVPGELNIAGSGLARGYLADAELTAQTFVPDPVTNDPGGRIYRSGDIVRFRKEGALEFLGRTDQQVKIRGYRIELGEIEAALLAHEAVEDAVVMTRGDEADRRPVAYIVTKGERSVTTSQIRNHLKTRLPEQMIPSAIVKLEALPLTANGKVNRRALPAPDSTRPDLSEAFVPPRTQNEKMLAEIWKQILSLELVGVHDNFFELGGDSILSIQVITQANQAGLRLTPRQIFQQQTIANLAAVADTARTIEAEQQAVTGRVPLTPIQRWFFEQDFADPHHYNQAVMLEARQPIDTAAFGRAVERLTHHHDALRLRFRRDEGAWAQINEELEKNPVVSRIDLSQLGGDESERATRTAAASAQASLDLSCGPLVRFVWFDYGDGGPARLLILIHHLAVDGVSWRILLEDLESAYRQIELPPKTTSFKQWAERLSESDLFAGETGYWLNPEPASPTPMPVDFCDGADTVASKSSVANTVASESSVTVSLDVEQTRSLLRDVPPVYHTQINDVLLTALALAYGHWSGRNQTAAGSAGVSPARLTIEEHGRRDACAPSSEYHCSNLLVTLEGHGREPIFEELDLTRTVGWFTTTYPVCLDIEIASDEAGALKSVKEQLRSIPNRGFGYGALRYLTGDPQTAAKLGEIDRAEISFNYLGQLDQAVSESSLFALSRMPVGPVRSPRAKRSYLLEINGWIVEGRLELEWIYSRNIHRGETIEALANGFIDALTALITHCQSEGAGGHTPSDFPLASIDQAGLDKIIGSNRVVEDIYPLSPTQQGMLFHSLYEPEAGIYVSQMACELNGDLDLEAFNWAWQQVVNRHEVLRTKIVLDDLPSPLQVVLGDVELPVDYQDWRSLGEAEQETRLHGLLAEDRRRGFDFGKAPLMRVGLIRLADSTYQFAWSHHHMLLDGWSASALLKEVFSLYEARSGNEEPRLERARPYRDYIEWVQKQDKSRAEEYWRVRLKGYEAPTMLGVGRPALLQDQPEEVYAEVRFDLDEAATEKLARFARQYQLTLNSIVQGAWAVLLSRYSGERDVVFGATTSGRALTLEGVDKMIGLFINTLPARIEMNEQAAAVDRLRHIQQKQADQQEYEYSSLRDIQRWSDLEPGARLFESIVVFENYPVDASLKRHLEGGGSLEISKIKSVEPTNYGLTVAVVPGREFRLEIGYDRRQYEDQTVSRMLGHLAALLEGIVSDACRRVSDLPMLSQSEHQQLVLDWRGTPADFPLQLSIHDLFERQAQESHDAVAVVAGGEQVTYEGLDRRANQLANYLRSDGVGPERIVGVCLERSIAMVVALVAVAKAGGTYVPLDPSYPKERLRYMLDETGARMLLTQHNLIDLFDEHGVNAVCLDKDWPKVSNYDDRITPAALTPDDAVYVVFTSGSTGTPKGVIVSHRGLLNECSGFARHHGLGPNERLLQFGSIGFDVTAEEVFAPLISGATIVLAPNDAILSISELLNICDRHGLTVLNLPSTYWHEWVGELSRGKRQMPSSLRLVIVGNEKALAEKLEQWQRIVRSRIEWKNAYGPTEATVTTTIYRAEGVVNNGDFRSVPIGRPIWNAEVYLLDKEMRPVPVGVAGELYIGGPGVARGYLNQPDMTAERFRPNRYGTNGGERLYGTGDLARYLEDGNIEFIGRADDQVKVRGYRIELGEVEAALNLHPAVKEGAVLIKEGAAGDGRLVGYIVFANGASANATDLRGFLKERLPEFMIPATFAFLDKMPKTPSGKIDRRSLPRLEATGTATPRGLPPRTELERTLAGIWQDVLGVERVGTDDNFFNIGGDSILSLQIVSRAAQAGIKLTPKQVFERPTVGELAAVAASADDPVDAEQGTVAGRVTLTPIQQWFFEQEISERGIYSHTVLLEVGEDLNAKILKRTIEKVIDHHDGLRMRFRDSGGAWEQENAERETAAVFSVLDLSATEEWTRQSVIQQVAEQAGQGLNLDEGPLIRVVLLDLGGGVKRLMIAIHHLVIDAVSWRVLLEDLRTAYEQLSKGNEINLPAKTTSFRQWAELLRGYAQSEEIKRESAYWVEELKCAETGMTPNPRASASAGSMMRQIRVELREEETRALLKESPEAYHTHVDEMLLATLVEAYSEWSGESTLIVDLEGHGREEIVAGVDLSRTVGWFTTIFPVVLSKKEAEGIGDTLKRIKEQLRRVPRKGIGYGLLKYLTEDEELRSRIRALPRADLSFNYLGQIDQINTDFALMLEDLSYQGAPVWSQDYSVEINCMIRGRKLLIDWSYNESRCTKDAIDDLAQRYVSALRRLIDHCRSPEAGGFTPADFPDVDLSQKELDAFISEISEFID